MTNIKDNVMRERMSKDFQALFPTDPLQRALQAFAYTKNGITPVLNEEGTLVGILTKNHVIRALAEGHDFETPIEPFVHFNPICITPDSTSTEIRSLFVENSISHAPVVNSKNQPVGVVSTPHILYRWQERFKSMFPKVSVFDKIDTGLITINEQMRLIAVNPIARSIFENEITSDFSQITARYPSIAQLVTDTLETKKESPKIRMTINETNLLVQCTPLFEIDDLSGAMLVLEHIDNLKEIQNPEEKLRTALELTDGVGLFSDAISLVNENGHVTHVNEGFCELFNTTERDMLRKPIFDKIPDLSIREALEHGTPQEGLHRMIGSQKCIVSIIPIKDGDTVLGAVCKIIYKGLENLQVDTYSNSKVINKNQTLTGAKYSFDDIIGDSQPIQKVKREALAASKSQSTVLLIGESGTGKELFAHGIHVASGQPGPFVKVNCAAIPEELLESEFFGYDEGAFTGARKGGKKGKFELAQNGTLFLDEIGDMPLSLQSKLLRALQEKEIEPVGSHRTIQIQTKIIAATNKNLEQLVREGKFREDLYYRLTVLPIYIPSLRERKDDIPLIIHFLLKRLKSEGFFVKEVTPQALQLMLDYDWPGNVRELHNVLERGANLTTNGFIDLDELPPYLLKTDVSYPTSPITTVSPQHSEKSEKQLILNVLAQANGNKTKASEILGKSRTWLYSKMKEYEID